MFSRSSWLHLRIPFSYFLLPVFFFAASVSENISEKPLLWTLLIVHLLLYPASNGYNSYFDKDEKSIGGLKNPPPVKKGLYYLAILLDIAAIVLGFWKINATFAIMLLIYGLVSKAYSHPAIRLKKYAITSWFVAGTFQGLFTFIMCYAGINRYDLLIAFRPDIIIPGILCTLVLWANYPMTQIYQHEEDFKRGDFTLSYRLGIRGTFVFTAITFLIAAIGFIWYFNVTPMFGIKYGYQFLLATSPVVMYFGYWFWKTWRDPSKADYAHTMWLNFISATCLNAFFIYLALYATHLIQVFS
jgi:1,4-dihydroxy-2-naphthoate octaprenyltransferase